ncbi:hypothetical protein V5799_003875 [Amblyomma americanum]|uniref:Uncharacterized protein n=1 Tax=Amblyomma americanum TaxID=6943 RepID=A0AAQ4D7Q3_AMBAM
MAARDGREDESALDGDGVRGRLRSGAGTGDEESGTGALDSGGRANGGRSGLLSDVGDVGVPALAPEKADANRGEEEMDFQLGVFGGKGRKGKLQQTALDESSDQGGSGQVVNISVDKATMKSSKSKLRSHSLSSRQRIDQTGAFYEVESSKEMAPYADTVKLTASDQDGLDRKRALPTKIQNITAAQLWQLRSEKLKLLLRKQRKMAKRLKESESKQVVANGGSVQNEPSEKASRVDIGFQKEVAQLTSAKKWSSGIWTNRKGRGSVVPSEQNSDEQRMIKGIPPSIKEDNEVLSFSEFFKNHLSPKQRHSMVRDGLKNVHGPRLMIDYTSNRKGKEALVEGFEAGGWPEKPEEPPPTKYTLDPFHPYIARRGAGWDFYNPLKPATERNNARELAEQEFYSPEQPSFGVQSRLSRRFWAAPAVTSAPFFQLNETSISPRNNTLGHARVAGLQPAVSAVVRNAVPSFKTWPKGNIEESPQNNPSLTLLGHYEVTNETVDAGSQGIAVPVRQASNIWRRSKKIGGNDGIENHRSVDLHETERQNSSRATSASNQTDDEEYPFGRLSRDEAPRSKVSSSDVGTPVNLTATTADKSGTQTGTYREGTDSHPEATGEDQKRIPRIETNTSDAALKGGGGSVPIPSGEISQNNEADIASREVGSQKMPGNSDIAPSRKRATIQEFEGNGNAAAPLPAGHPVVDKNKISASDPRNTSGRVADNSIGMENPGGKGLMNIEPIPIEGPEFNLSAEVNAANVTTPDATTDSVSQKTGPWNYEDIVPEEDRNILSSTLHREYSGNATRFREEFGENSSSTGLPSSRLKETSNSTQNFEPEAMHLTPPKVGLASPVKRAFTRSRRGMSTPRPPQSSVPATNLSKDEKDNDFDDFHNAEDTYLRIDVRTVKKLEVPTEPSNVDIGIQNKVNKLDKSTASVPVAWNEVAPRGVIKIVNGRRTSPPGAIPKEQSSTQSSEKEQPTLQTLAPIRVPKATNTSDTARETKSEYTRGSSPLFTESRTSWSERVALKIVDTLPVDHTSYVLKSSRPAEKSLKDEPRKEPKPPFMDTAATRETHPPESFGSRDVSISAPRLRSEHPASRSEQNTTLGAANGITIDILRKNNGLENVFDINKRHEETRSTVHGVPFVRIAVKNASHTASRAHISSRAFSKRALVEEVTTFTPPSQSSETIAKKHTEIIVPVTRSTVRPVPFVGIAVKNSSRTTDHVPSPASNKNALVEEVTTVTPLSHSSGTIQGKHTQSTSPPRKPALKDKLPDHFTEPPSPVEDKKNLSLRETHTTKGKVSASRTTGVRKYSLDINTSARHVVDEKNPSSASSANISMDFHIPERAHEDGKTSTLRRITLVVEKTSAEKKTATSTMTTANKRRLIKEEMSTSDIRTVETELTNKRTDWTSTSLSTASAAKAGPIEFTSGAVKHPKRSHREENGNHENVSTSKPGTPSSDTAASKGHSKFLSSTSNILRKGQNFVTSGYTTKPSKPFISFSEPSQHQSGTATSTVREPKENKAKTFVSKSGTSSPATSSSSRPSSAKSVSTASTTLPPSSDTPIPDLGFGDDMLGRFGDGIKAPNSTLGAKKPKEQATPETPAPNKQPVQAWTVAKPRIEVVPLTTLKEETSSKTSRPAVPEQPQTQPQETTTAATEPTAVVFDVNDDDDEEDEARLHFPMMKIRRRPSTTRRRPAIMDLFGRGLPTSSRPTTLRPVLQHHIAVRRGRPERAPTLRPRLQHDIAMKRRHHRSQRPRPYRMTLFHDEPLQAVRIPVKRMG